MAARVAEHVFRGRPFGPKIRYRVDLHGVSVFGPGQEHTVVRWEWIEEISAGAGVVVRSANAEIRLPRGTFGLDPEHLADRLRRACSIEWRGEIIGELTRR